MCSRSTTAATGRGIRSKRAFRLDDVADDVIAVADVLGIDRFIPVGYSMGGRSPN